MTRKKYDYRQMIDCLKSSLKREFTISELSEKILKFDKELRYGLDYLIETLKKDELVEINTLFSDVKFYQFRKERR